MSDQNKSNNGLNHASNDGLNDADIKHLFDQQFDQQNDEPPKALDARILAAAKTTNKVLPEAAKPTRFNQKYTAVFGLAAMVLLGVVIVPLMMQQPEYPLDANNTSNAKSNEESVASLFEKEKKLVIAETDQVSANVDVNVDVNADVSADVKAESADEPEASGRSEAGNTKADADALTSALSSGQAAQAKRAHTTARVQATATPQNTEITAEERETPKKWIQAIKRLFEQNSLVQAKAELTRFRAQHPASEHEALLPAALLTQD